MKVLYMGNIHKTTVGPCVVNRELYGELYNSIDFITAETLIKKLNQFFNKFFRADLVHLSGLGGFNFLACILSVIFRKKLSYTMHGAYLFESKFYSRKISFRFFEYLSLAFSDKIICVSATYIEMLLQDPFYKKFSEKYILIHNGIKSLDLTERVFSRDKETIISIGGGRGEKNIVNICKAIEKLNKTKKFNLRLVVIGADGADSNVIKGYDFVSYKGQLAHNDLVECLYSSQIYIQNSHFESFGLSTFEAIQAGCDIVMTDRVGMRECIDGNIQGLIIPAAPTKRNIEALIRSINYTLANPNNSLVVNNINFEDLTWNAVACSYLLAWESIFFGQETN